ncbi:restriction endonuclease fold toxin 5 domain-containing protein [Burkholderia thailandensis]|uniref:restriction endonuclease fold toxin 5 domain-containing protein n=5 Tax=Burkholderia thailandensis TaxID=57975 RepID=UPI0004F7A7ED|nr:restriction endonuclease fold toxin 5 domain-containing protein [Burkholderia thailandensis]MCS3391646.1 restriction endonuclease fold toxin 5 domain-containing protein [Burkholderia thailandensis]MCS6424965.1 restriction endonuclease fold toxin 5 domain-containing protein [Burkholderia thailandensis]MCS6452698.1 restriction endonuclease fold toxin 5 domain-containing protein [Burkholderia thailandensis]MCS6464382.1 restriction endonuclease fold toxin 5 domain-containing protein [Burkholderi
MVFPVIEAAAVELGPILARVGVALLGGATVAGTASLSGDTPKEDSKATPDVRALPRTGESCKKCPPEQTGTPVRRRYRMNRGPREYQGRITGRPYSVEEGWSEEWNWYNVDFDGFLSDECLLLEAKGDYDQFFSRSTNKPFRWFKGFSKITREIEVRAMVIHANPPTKLKYYFQTPLTMSYFRTTLAENGIPFVVTG